MKFTIAGVFFLGVQETCEFWKKWREQSRVYKERWSASKDEIAHSGRTILIRLLLISFVIHGFRNPDYQHSWLGHSGSQTSVACSLNTMVPIRDRKNLVISIVFVDSFAGSKNFESQPNVNRFIHIFLLVVSTTSKNISQNGILLQVGVKTTNIWNHHLVLFWMLKTGKYIYGVSAYPISFNHFKTEYLNGVSLSPQSQWKMKSFLSDPSSFLRDDRYTRPRVTPWTIVEENQP